jgi:hypothetical protein
LAEQPRRESPSMRDPPETLILPTKAVYLSAEPA